MSSSKIWLIAVAFMAGILVTPLFLILTTGHDDSSLPPLNASPMVQSGGLDFDEATATPPPQPIGTTTSIAPTQAPAASAAPTAARPPATPEAQSSPPPEPPGGGPTLSGRFRIIDTVTNGQGSGTVVSFDVALQQNGATVTGGNSELNLSGRMEGKTLRAQFVQSGLGYTGTFTWQLDASGGVGEFSTSVPNGGSSQLLRL